jgi:hypothetical protein
MFRPKQSNESCKLLHLCVTTNRDSLNAFVVVHADLTTSVEEATNHFAVGVAFIIRFSVKIKSLA